MNYETAAALKYDIINYIISPAEYDKVKHYADTFSVLDTAAINSIEMFIIKNTGAFCSVNRGKTIEALSSALLYTTTLSKIQIDVIFHNVQTIGKYIIPVTLSDDQVNMIFIEI